MTDIANTDQYAAWNGDSGQRWIADADRRDRIMAPIADSIPSPSRTSPPRSTPSGARSPTT